jgi:hypothetical protein
MLEYSWKWERIEIIIRFMVWISYYEHISNVIFDIHAPQVISYDINFWHNF